MIKFFYFFFFFFQAEDGIRDLTVTGVQTCALPILLKILGPGQQLAVDANGRFDLATALDYGRALGQYPLFWYEEAGDRSEEHTSELQSQSNLVCRLLLEKKKKK